MQVTESMRMALHSIRANKLRAGLTLLSIAIGVFAIIGVAAAVAALDSKVGEQLDALGRNSFTIQKTPALEFGHGRNRYRNRPEISLRQALEFKSRMTGAEQIGLTNFSGTASVRYGSESTDPDVLVQGGDEAFITNFGYEIAEGRSLDPADVQAGSDIVVMGADVAAKVFVNRTAVGGDVRINGHRYLVVGVLEPRGAVFGQSQDNFVLIPITSAVKRFVNEWESSITLTVRATSIEALEETVDRAIGAMRIIRKLEIGEENNFEVATNDDVAETFGGFTGYISLFGLLCGAIALTAAGIGIMNIMLVSVKERTREIGIRKAVGATRRAILTQFMIEAVTLCQLGALCGIALGLGGGLAMSVWLDVTPSVPWNWVVGAVLFCLGVGVIFGSYPAWKASRLDPIEALRYE